MLLCSLMELLNHSQAAMAAVLRKPTQVRAALGCIDSPVVRCCQPGNNTSIPSPLAYSFLNRPPWSMDLLNNGY